MGYRTLIPMSKEDNIFLYFLIEYKYIKLFNIFIKNI